MGLLFGGILPFRVVFKERDDLRKRFERRESEQVQAIAPERDALIARLTAIQPLPLFIRNTADPHLNF